MRAIVTIITLILLSGCVNYNQPLYDDGQGVYYDDRGSAYSVSSSSRFGSFAVYPWWSMDYFYLGYHPYGRWPFTYYSPYFYPHYFSVMHPPWHWNSHYWYGGYYAWRDPYWHHRYRHYYHSVATGPIDTGGNYRRSAVAPSGRSGGMTVVSPESRKERPSRVSPTTPTGISAAVIPYSAITPGQFQGTSTTSGVVAPAVPSKQASVPVRKSSAARTKPFRYEKSRPLKLSSPSPVSHGRTSTIPGRSSMTVGTKREPVVPRNPYREKE